MENNEEDKHGEKKNSWTVIFLFFNEERRVCSANSRGLALPSILFEILLDLGTPFYVHCEHYPLSKF